jgi:hypothetical protein
MKNLSDPTLARYRRVDFEMKVVGDCGNPYIGVFQFASVTDKRALRCIVSAVDGWDHVSVSRVDRIPNWEEMCQIKELFFEENETAMQVHPPRSEWINNHQYCLHLWRSHTQEIPKPPSYLVGYPELNVK